MDFHYLVRRARWLEKRLAGTSETNPGHVFDVNEYKELLEVFSRVGVRYAPDPKPQPATRKLDGDGRTPRDYDQPPVVEDIFIPGASHSTVAHGRRPRDVGHADLRGRYIPGGL